MPGPVVRALAADRSPAPAIVRDRDVLAAYLEDASSSGPGSALGLLRPASEAEVAAFLRETLAAGVRVLPQAARSSLTGGATPRGEVVLSSERMNSIGALQPDGNGARIDVDPGVRLRDLQQHLVERGFYYPPVPTFQEAMVGGTVSTNAGGAASFKYGVTRDWVQGLRVLLFNGDTLAIERGEFRAERGESFSIALSDGTSLDVPVPGHTLPALKKISAGYYAASPLDLVDLFVGSEGTLGWISRVTLRLVRAPGTVLTGLAFVDSSDRALQLTAALRDAGERARRAGGWPDVRAVEWMDEQCLGLLRIHGDARRVRVSIPGAARGALLFEVEFAAPLSAADAEDALEAFERDGDDRNGHDPSGRDPEGRDHAGCDPADDGRARHDRGQALGRLFRILQEHQALDDIELAFPGDDARAESLREFREAVPRRVNEILAERRRGDGGVSKVGGDLIVPFAALGEMMRSYREGFERRGLEYAVWGHISDGNLHPNAIPKNAAEAESARAAQLEFADRAARCGGSPLSEHGVGRSPLKQEILRRFLGDATIEALRRIKASLDPPGRFAPGVMFPAS